MWTLNSRHVGGRGEYSLGLHPTIVADKQKQGQGQEV